MKRMASSKIAILAVVALALGQYRVAAQCSGTQNYDLTAGGVLTLNSDNFPSNYADYSACRWKLTGPPGSVIQLTFVERFDVEQGAGCVNDYVVIFDNAKPGVDAALASTPVCRANSALIPSQGPSCGTNLPPSYLTKRNVATVQFCTDYSVTGAGWKLNVVALDASVAPTSAPWVTPNVTLSSFGEVQTIRSPNYPNNYNDDYSAKYIITNLRSGTTLRLAATQFNLGASNCNDKLVIVDLNNNRTFEYCGNKPFAELELPNAGVVVVYFETDLFDTFAGFSIDLSLVACAGSQFPCDDNEGCYSPAQACNGERDCDDGSDEKVDYCAPECGVAHYPINLDDLQPNSTAPRIVGGHIVNRHSIPWQASMQQLNGFHFCGGTVITDRWIMSAAHCFDGTAPSSVKVRLGGFMLSLTPEMDRATEYRVEKVRCHPYFDLYSQLDYDYCLIKLTEPIKFRKNIAPACMAHQGEDEPAGKRCLVSGWGDTKLSNPGRKEEEVQEEEPIKEILETAEDIEARVAANRLRQVITPIVERSECNRIASLPGIVTDRMVCAGETFGGKGSCHGDSGGPFMCQNDAGRWILAGAVSWGSPQCIVPNTNVPTVYARTGAVSNWMVDTMAAN